MKRVLLQKKEGGHLGQYEDWWYLVRDDQGDVYVEHEWDYVQVRGLTKNEGTEKLSASGYFNLTGADLDAKIQNVLG